MSDETANMLVPSGDEHSENGDNNNNSASQPKQQPYRDYESIGSFGSNGGQVRKPEAGDDERDSDGARDSDDGGRLQNLALIALTTPGIKFFKSAQSSFQEYLMTDPALRMTATTYGVLLTLISLPIVPLVGGALLDLSGDRAAAGPRRAPALVTGLSGSLAAAASRTREQRAAQASAFCLFLLLALLGIAVYGLGLERWHSIPAGLAGAALFGAGEGCVMVAARAFVGHEFRGGDGAAAQGVLIATNNLAMMASKNVVPRLIERARARAGAGAAGADGGIRGGVRACLVVQLLSLGAGVAYFRRNRAPAPRGARRRGPPRGDDDAPGDEGDRVAAAGGSCRPHGGGLATLVSLPLTFWIVATGRAIFLVTFKVFNRYSNSFLIEKFGVDAVSAGRTSSLGELFALFSPLVGYLAYRSPGGIVAFAMGAAVLGAASIGSLAFCSAAAVTAGLPGGIITPMVGISIAHGVIIPISIAMIPHTVPAQQLGTAFAVFEVLGSTLMLTDIVFGWLRDRTGDYDVPMQLLFVYALVGASLLWASRDRLGSIGIGR